MSLGVKMAISEEPKYASLNELWLDPRNPRLGQARISEGLNQKQLLEVMGDWTLEELAISYLEGGGFWTHEALLVAEEEYGGEPK